MSRHIFSSEAARMLGIGASTLRKYAAVIESRGYQFERGANNGRIFSQEDLQLFTQLIEQVANGMKLEDAVAELIETDKPVFDNDSSPTTELADFMEQIKDLERQQALLTEMNATLVKQVERLTEKIEERERDQLLFKMVEEKKKRKRKGIALLRPLNVFGGK